MANTVVQLKKSGTSGNIPSALNFGEVAINYADGILFYKAIGGAVTPFIMGARSFATVNANSTLILAGSNNDILSIVGSNTINVVGNSSSKQITISSNVLTGLVPGSYTNANLNVDQYGRVLSASNGSGGAGVTNTAVYLTSSAGTGSQTAFVLSNPTTNNTIVHAFVGGVYQMAASYTFTGNTVTFTEAPGNGIAIEFTSYIPSNTTTIQVSSFNGRTGAVTLLAADLPGGGNANYANVANSSLTTSIAMDVFGGVANQILYQTAANATSYMAAPVVSDTVLSWNTTSGFSWVAQSAGGSSTGNTVVYLSSFTGTGATNSFKLSNPSPNTQMVFVNGVYQMFAAGAYTMSGNTVVFSENPYNGAIIEVTSFANANAVTIIPMTSFNTRTGAITLTTADISAATLLGALTNNVEISSGITSSSPTTGALVITGGLGIGGNVNIGGTTSFSNTVTFDTSSTLNPSMIVPNGVLLTAPQSGAIEANVGSLFYTGISSRQIIPSYYYFRNNASNTLISQTAAQSWLGLKTGVTVQTGVVYEFEGEFNLATTGTTSHTESIGFTLTTATVTNIGFTIKRMLVSVTANAEISAYSANSGMTVITGAITTGQNVIYQIKGTISINAGGQIRPDIAFSSAPGGASTITLGAYFRMNPIGTTGNNVVIGAWA